MKKNILFLFLLISIISSCWVNNNLKETELWNIENNKIEESKLPENISVVEKESKLPENISVIEKESKLPENISVVKKESKLPENISINIANIKSIKNNNSFNANDIKLECEKLYDNKIKVNNCFVSKITKIYNINNWKNICEQSFTDKTNIKNCYINKLSEMNNKCINWDLDIPIEDIYVKNEISWLDSNTIKLAINDCKQFRENIRNEKVNKDIDNQVDWFNLNKCKNAVDYYIENNIPKGIWKEYINEEKKLKLNECKIWYSLNYWNWCKDLKWSDLFKECIHIKNNIDTFLDLKSSYEIYWSFNLEKFLWRK